MNLYDLDFELRGIVENLLFKIDEEYSVTEKQMRVIERHFNRAVNAINDDLWEMEEAESERKEE